MLLKALMLKDSTYLDPSWAVLVYHVGRRQMVRAVVKGFPPAVTERVLAIAAERGVTLSTAAAITSGQDKAMGMLAAWRRGCRKCKRGKKQSCTHVDIKNVFKS